MTKRLIRDDGARYTFRQLQADNPKRSFRNPPTAVSLEGTRGRLAMVEDKPNLDPDTQKLVEQTVQENGEWFIRYEAFDLTEQELSDRATAKRQNMTVERWSFATAAMAAGIITAEEAQAWGPGNSLPAAIDQAISAAVTDPTELAAAKVRALAAPKINRLNPLIEILRGALNLTPEQADDLFAAAAQIEAAE